MPRANSSVPRRKKHKKIIKSAKGYFGTRKSNYRTAKDAVQKSLQYSYRDRKAKKRDFRKNHWQFTQAPIYKILGLVFFNFTITT